MKKKIFAIILVVSVLLGACAPQSAAEPTAEPTPVPETEQEQVDLGTIKVGYIPILGFVPFFVAQERGYFADEGLEVELQTFRTGDDMIAPLGLGQLDVGGGETGPALFNAIDQDLDVQVVGALAAQPEGRGAVPLLVRRDLLESGEVQDVSDLAGRKIALNVERGMAEYLLAKALESAGLTVDDVEMVTIPFPEVPQALANAAVDAAILPHPLASVALRPGEDDAPPIAGVLIEGDQITEYPQNGVLYYGQRLLEPENHDVGVRFMVAFLRAARDVQGDDWRSNDEIVNAILEYTTVPEPAVRNGVAYYFDPNGEINVSSSKDIQDYHFGRAYTDMEDPLTWDQIFVGSFVEEAVAELGTYEE